MRVARDYMAANFERNIGNRELASLTGLSRYHFVRSFRRAFGIPPHAYLNQIWLLAAKRLLEEGRSPGEAAAAAGFFDQSHLTRLFKRACGITPAVYAVPARDRSGARALNRTAPSDEVAS
jgi:AraC-like DNA-binding protein